MTDLIVNATLVRDWALALVQEWWPGYTDVLGDGKQRRLRVEKVEQDHLVVSVQAMGNHSPTGPTRLFRVNVEVLDVLDE